MWVGLFTMWLKVGGSFLFYSDLELVVEISFFWTRWPLIMKVEWNTTKWYIFSWFPFWQRRKWQKGNLPKRLLVPLWQLPIGIYTLPKYHNPSTTQVPRLKHLTFHSYCPTFIHACYFQISSTIKIKDHAWSPFLHNIFSYQAIALCLNKYSKPEAESG